MKKRTANGLFYFVAFVIATLVVSVASEAGQATKTEQVAVKHLEGRWIRPDGGYVLELQNTQKDGSVTAAYYNPKPIKVYRAEVKRKGGKIHLRLELRDINYPGSTYTLTYDPATDRLKGVYFQAVEKRSFDVEFARIR